MKNLFKRLLPQILQVKIRDIKIYFGAFSLQSYSQEGEDMILRRLFEGQKSGFYIDVGAHHPFRFSNTCFFYKLGWRGINIDAMPDSMKIFDKFRPRDINIESPVSAEKKILNYYMFNEPALNGFDKKLSEIRDGIQQYKIERIIPLQTKRLDELLDEYLPKKQQIDFLNIDVEGLDFEVLKSNNWSIFQPKVILVEILESSLEDLIKNDISKYLKDYGYEIYAKSFNTVIFKKVNYSHLSDKS
jgi:FkbM family methyltransferase